MTHLRIELNTTGIEEVSSSVIEKLYELANSGNLDASSNLKGRLNVNITYLDYITYLLEQFPGTNNKGPLYITATDIALRFLDPEVLRILTSNNIGSNGMITLSLALSALNIPNFTGNSDIVSFNELRYFTNIGTIASNKFKNCSNLLSIDLRNISLIQTEAFANCTSLTTVTMPSSSCVLYEAAFDGCTNLSNIDLSNVTTLNGFAYCTSLTSVDLSSCTSIGVRAFFYCTNLESVLLPSSGLTSLGVSAFEGTKIASIALPSSLTSLGSASFKNCTRLATIDLSNVTSIGTEAFSGCTSLTSANLEKVTSIGNSAFYDSLNGATISLAGLTTASYGGLRNCKMSSVTSLGSISNIPELFLTNCPNLTSVVLPVSCTLIVPNAIKDNPLLSSINLENITNLGARTFTFCPNMPELINFPNVTTLTYDSGNDSYDGYCGSTNTKYVYFPKLTAAHRGFDWGGNNVSGMFIPAGWQDLCHAMYIVYFRDISSLYTGCFCGSAIRNLVINNITPPTVTPHPTLTVTNDLLNSTLARSTITNIYVPDAAVTTYQSTAYWQDMNILPISLLNKVATKTAWDELSDNDKANTLIEEYM